MINFIIKNAIKKFAVKVATDKKLREKMQTGVNNARELNSRGELLKSLGKAAGRIKSKIKS